MVARLLFLAVLMGISCPLFAQVDRATLTGTITDPTGAVVAGARVELVSIETGLRRETLTVDAGTYAFSRVPIGLYTVTASLASFRTVTLKDLRLGVGDQRTLNIH
jgi:hypothetical protein